MPAFFLSAIMSSGIPFSCIVIIKNPRISSRKKVRISPTKPRNIHLKATHRKYSQCLLPKPDKTTRNTRKLTPSQNYRPRPHKSWKKTTEIYLFSMYSARRFRLRTPFHTTPTRCCGLASLWRLASLVFWPGCFWKNCFHRGFWSIFSCHSNRYPGTGLSWFASLSDRMLTWLPVSTSA